MLKPGGWIESLECSPDLECADSGAKSPDTSALSQWGAIFFEYGDRIGRTFRIVNDNLQSTIFEKLGFMGISSTNIDVRLKKNSSRSRLPSRVDVSLQRGPYMSLT